MIQLNFEDIAAFSDNYCGKGLIILFAETAQKTDFVEFVEDIQRAFFLAEDAVRRIGPVFAHRAEHRMGLFQASGNSLPFLYVRKHGCKYLGREHLLWTDEGVHRAGYDFQDFLPFLAAGNVVGQVDPDLGNQHGAFLATDFRAAIGAIKFSGIRIAGADAGLRLQAPVV